MSNGEALDKVTGGPPPPSSTGYFLTNSADMSTLETLLVNIQGLVKLAVEKTCQKEQQINFERGRSSSYFCRFLINRNSKYGSP